MENESVNMRIESIIENLNVTNRNFALQIGVDPSVLHNIVSGRRSAPSYQLLEKILLTFEHIDARWLLTGIVSKNYDLIEKSASVIHDDTNTYLNSKRCNDLKNEILNLKGQIEAYKSIITNLTCTKS